MFRTLMFVAALVGCASILSAQAIDPDTFKVNYFNAAGLDNTVRMTNAGTSGGDLCADIYVFDPSQEMLACCSCLVTPDGLATLNVVTNLVRNTVTGEHPINGAIKIVSSSGTCSITGLPLPTAPKPAPGIRAWGTHFFSGGFLTETAFQDAGLSAAELSNLGAQCNAIKIVGSGHGVCSCGSAPG